MRDRSREAGADHRADVLVDWPVDPLAADDRPAAGRGRRRRASEDVDPDATERISLIEFTWHGQTGAQQVIFVSREWLQ